MDTKLADGLGQVCPELSGLESRAWDNRALGKEEPLGRAELAGEATADYTIMSMAREFGITVQEIEHYEDSGLLRSLPAASSRAYGPRDRLHLKMILKGKALGFTLSEIRDILGAKDAAEDARSLETFDSAANRGATARQPGRHEGFDASMADWAMALRPEQIAAQIEHLERQRKALDDAIQILREAQHRRIARDRHGSR